MIAVITLAFIAAGMALLSCADIYTLKALRRRNGMRIFKDVYQAVTEQEGARCKLPDVTNRPKC